jgi:dihydroorotase
MEWTIRGGRILDPSTGRDEVADLHLCDGVIVERCTEATEVDARGKWVVPGFVDLHVHAREPGEEYKEDIASASAAAVFGGVTTFVTMPNTQPVIDSGELVKFVIERGAEAGLCRVLPSGAVTVGQRGKMLAPLGELCAAGAVAVTDDGHPIMDAGLMRRGLEYASDVGVPVFTHAEDLGLSQGGDMHEGLVSTRLGLQGIPRTAEDVAVSRDCLLALEAGARLHVCHVSTRGAVDAIRRARALGALVSGEAAPHHFALTHDHVDGYNTSAKMNPPLREEDDKMAVIEGVADGTLQAIATDHAPHSSIEKDVAFSDACNGVIGLQTTLPLSLALWRAGHLDLMTLLRRLTVGPAEVLGLGCSLSMGAPADVVIVDPDAQWTFDAAAVRSKSVNSPFLGWKLQGRVVCTFFRGLRVYECTTSTSTR